MNYVYVDIVRAIPFSILRKGKMENFADSLPYLGSVNYLREGGRKNDGWLVTFLMLRKQRVLHHWKMRIQKKSSFFLEFLRPALYHYWSSP